MKPSQKPIVGAFQALVASFPKGDPRPAPRQPPTDLRAAVRKPKRKQNP